MYALGILALICDKFKVFYCVSDEKYSQLELIEDTYSNRHLNKKLLNAHAAVLLGDR